jgi:SAM-dependent methyltransferase
LVGDNGKVIGVDMNDDMLGLALKYQAEMATKLGGDRVEFRKGHIQDLALDLAAMDAWLADNPVTDVEGAHQLELWQVAQSKDKPLIADNSVDLIISNCVLNLVGDHQKQQLASEIFRVLKPGGRIAISDIVSDEAIPEHLKADDELWSGCISGAFEEEEILNAFHDVGFLSVSLDKWDAEPWQVVEGIEFRSVTVTAVKGSGEACLDKGQAVIYKGPFKTVFDDEGHEFPRGARMAVCERTFRYLTEGLHKNDFIGITPAEKHEAVTWCEPAGTRRPASETKGGVHKQASTKSSCC